MENVLQADGAMRIQIGLGWQAHGGEIDSSHPNDFDHASSYIRDIRPEGDVVCTEPTAIFGSTGLVRWMDLALRGRKYSLRV